MTGQHEQSNHETYTSQVADLDTVLRRYVADPTASWGLGTFGAVAEFHRTEDEPASITAGATHQVVTTRGALRLNVTEEVRAFAYELPAAGDSWNQALTLCLPTVSTALPRRAVLTECGPDRDAPRPHD